MTRVACSHAERLFAVQTCQVPAAPLAPALLAPAALEMPPGAPEPPQATTPSEPQPRRAAWRDTLMTPGPCSTPQLSSTTRHPGWYADGAHHDGLSPI